MSTSGTFPFISSMYINPETNVASITFPSVDLGPEFEGRQLLVAVGGQTTGTTGQVSRVTVGGTRFDPDKQITANRGVVSIWRGKAVGTVADIVVTGAATFYDASIAVYALPPSSVIFSTYEGASVGTLVTGSPSGTTVAAATAYEDTSLMRPTDIVVTDAVHNLRAAYGHTTSSDTFTWSYGNISNAYTRFAAVAYEEAQPETIIYPDEIPGLRFWLDGADLVGDEGDPIATWSGHGGAYGMSQTDTLKQPTVTYIDGFKAANFNGTHYLENTSVRGLDNNQTVIIVSRGGSSIGSTDRWLWGVSSGTGFAVAHRSTSAVRPTMYGGDWANSTWPSQPLLTWGIRAGRFWSAQSLESRLNDGTPLLSTTTTVTTQDRWNHIGGNAQAASYVGQIVEVIQYNRALSDTEWDGVTRYLMNKYGSIL